MADPPLYSPINPHFFQPLLPGFTNHLVLCFSISLFLSLSLSDHVVSVSNSSSMLFQDIPVAFFLKHLVGSNKGTTAELRSDASEMTWRVKIDGRRLSNGWEDFTVAHDLRVGDIVVFRQEGELVFHVSALGPSCCEIQYRDNYPEEDKIEKLCDTEKVSRKKNSLKREADSAPEHSLGSCFVATVTASNLKRDTYIPKGFALSNHLMNKFQIVLMNEEGESWKIDLRRETYSHGRFYMRRGWRSFCIANGKKPGDSFAFKLVENEETPVLQLFPMTIEDLDKLQSVPREKSRKVEAPPSPDPSSFVATVTASNLSRDRLYLPKTFIMSNGLLKKFQMRLMNEEGESWTIDMKHEAHSGRFLTIRGWRSFCVANGKKPGDLFEFKLGQNEETPVLQLVPLNSEDLHKLEPNNDTRQGKCLEATKKEFLCLQATKKKFLGEEVYRNDSFKAIDEDIRKGQCSKAIKQEYVSTEENNSTSQNRFVTLTLTPSSKLNLPVEFIKGNGINKAGKITMLDRYDAKWPTSLLMDKRGTMSLGRGSKGFCEVNGVKMNESFVLELIWEDTVPLLKFCSKV
ncbi:B3 domain-containing protein REM10 isoform X2 [Arabidopsis lyrata subsp. lyrata]|uniref:B3 domain-containing protein REM10 isoform X2 n=1 Tax=Arabidopsis lyrata subsp. lyrata TaxID=81972 RepID=UPI000A29CAB1|nr:B3 domain-containing protein REM10 isoform X2 [Arabidopsis lyrata subsp. lyrata]|eukprot:XP_020885718.1 B3 domain-containing protein REM10 isoform X2 [Arabidopsis lyrata subsp. lyrata]